MSDKEKVMKRLSEHLEAVKGKHPEWVGIFLKVLKTTTQTMRAAMLIPS